MNETITTTNKSKSLNNNNHYKSYKDYKSKTKNQPQPEDDALVSIIGTIIGMGLAAVLFFGVILPIISAPNFGAKVLFFIVFWWLYLILGLLGVKIF